MGKDKESPTSDNWNGVNFDGDSNFADDAMKVIDGLKAERDKLREALEFYADKNKWSMDSNGFRVFNGAGGHETAVEALAESEQEGGADAE